MAENRRDGRAAGCPVRAFERADEDYAERVAEWIGNPHAFFTAFGPEARAFQKRHRSERLRTMTLVAPAAELAGMRPLLLSLDGREISVASWEEAFAESLGRLVAANGSTFAALQAAGELDWLGCPADGEPVAERLAAGTLEGAFEDLGTVVARVQWLFLMCGVRLNEVVVQVDPYTDEAWRERHAAIKARRAADKAFLEGRRAAQRAWAEAHPEEAGAGRL